ncbi:MAG: hypothetical protein AB7E05_10165 [Sphingobium sp.]
MVEVPSWSALFLGLFLFVCALGEVRRPGLWRAMVEELGASPGLQIMTGLCEMALGVAVYLCNRAAFEPASPDWLTVLMMALGGVMVIEAAAITAFTDLLFPFWRRVLERGAKGWAIFSLLAGAALMAAGLARLF